MNPDAQAELDTAYTMLSDPDPEVRRAYLASFGDDLPRKRRPMPKILFACGTDNDGRPTCQGDGTTCGLGGVCAELDPEPPAGAARAVVPPSDTATGDFLMDGGHVHEEDDDPEDDSFFTAKYDGRCSACEEFHIAAGETRIRADGYNGWEAEECAW